MFVELPELREHTVAPPALARLPAAVQLERELTLACRGGRPSAQTLAALGNVLLRRGAYVDALEAYRSAADLDAATAAYAWMCAEIAHVLDDRATSLTYRTRALALQRVFPDPLPVGDRASLLLLLRDAPYSENTPLELLLDRSRVAVHKYYVEGDALPDLPFAGAVMTGFGFAHAASHATQRAAAFADTINDPRNLTRTAREHVHLWANAIDGIVAPQIALVDAARLAELSYPVTMRPIDTHAGEGFELVASLDQARSLAQRYPANAYYVAPFIDYRAQDDEFYHKFRVIFVDGEPFPYHFAISSLWMVHYDRAPMDRVRGFREEEARFLAAPQRYVPQWSRIMSQIASAVDLDYFGIDAAMHRDGGIVLFEADAAMLVHDEDATGMFAYKRPYVARIREALHALIARRTSRRTP